MNLASDIYRFFIDEDFRIRVKTKLGMYKRMSDQDYIRMLFKANLGYEPNLENPSSFNEKLQWLKLHDRRPEYTVMADKYLAKQYIADRIGAQYVIPLLGVWRSADEIDFDKLPMAFVLKCNHNSGGVIACRDKSKLDLKQTRKILRKAIKEDYYAYGREWPYKDMPRRIIAEEYIEDECPPEGVQKGDLPDYKVLCFNGKPSFIEVHKGRFTAGHSQDWYDADWNWLEIEQSGLHKSESPMARPFFLNEMLEKSAVLSEGIPEVRVDWYHANGRLLFGELTFFDGSGFCRFFPEEWDLKIGSMIELSEYRGFVKA